MVNVVVCGELFGTDEYTRGKDEQGDNATQQLIMRDGVELVPALGLCGLAPCLFLCFIGILQHGSQETK